jgi:hypothetical protein
VTQVDSVDEPAEPSPIGSLEGSGFRTDEPPPANLQVDVPHSARMYDFFLGGKTHYPADRAAAAQALLAFPDMRTTTRQNRAFLHRAVRFLAEAGVDQFLDVGTGIPTSPNLHEVAQSVIPAARIVYVDNDPIVLAHARALLTSSPEGRTAYIEADLRRPADILASPALVETLDLTRPVALSLLAVLHFFPDATDPAAIVRQLVEPLPSGSYLVLSHGTADATSAETQSNTTAAYQRGGIAVQVRSRDEIAALLPATLQILEPGITMAHRWRPDSDPDLLSDTEVSIYGLIARKQL